jgi:Xaa-Pro aminopeptidase
MAEHELDALVVRAPDNVLYLTNFWGMKGYDACVFPREGEPVLITIEASEEDAARTAWTEDLRLIRGYDPADPRPPLARTLDAAVEAARDYERVGVELSLGTQASDRMVGEPTTFTAAWFDAFPEAADATPLLVRARSLKTEQELERLRLANELAAAAMDHVRELLRPAMREAQVAALWQGFVHGEGTGYHGDRRSARRRGRARPVRDLGLRRRLLGRPHEEPRRRRAQAGLRGARDHADGRLRRRARPHPARRPDG